MKNYSDDWDYTWYVMEKNSGKLIFGFDNYREAINYAKQIKQTYRCREYVCDYTNPANIDNWVFEGEYPLPEFL